MRNETTDAPKLKKPFSAKAVEAWSRPGNYSDGHGLYLQVARSRDGESLAKSWTFRYRHRLTQKLVELGLGSLADVSLGEARGKAQELRKQLAAGVDPKEARTAALNEARAKAARAITFDEAAARCIEGMRAGWRNPKHADQWTNTLKTYASPVFGSLPVAAVDLPLVRKVLDPIWATKNETASRVRQRIEAVLAWATVSKYRQGENPAAWKGNLDHLLAKPSKVKQVDHQPALPYAQMGEFMAALRGRDGVATMALELLILTAARTEAVRGARWSEIDLNKRLWTVPAARMKMKKEFTIPLQPRAVELLVDLGKAKTGELVFPGAKAGEGLSDAAMLAVVKRMNANRMAETGEQWADATSGKPVVPHGFRSTFRDWAGEQTTFAREVIEAGMAHQLKDKAEAAYARGTMPERRRKLMEAWAQYCDRVIVPTDNVAQLRANA